jgi:hypothetical protein
MRYISLILLGLCFLVTVSGCDTGEGAHYVSQTPMHPGSHQEEGSLGSDPQNVAEFKMVKVSIPPDLVRDNITVNSIRTFGAFTICDPELCQDGDCCQDRIFIENIHTSQIYEIQGLPLRWRPFSNLAWVTDHILTVDRWSQPHYGIRYTIDVVEMKIISTVSLSGG